MELDVWMAENYMDTPLGTYNCIKVRAPVSTDHVKFNEDYTFWLVK